MARYSCKNRMQIVEIPEESKDEIYRVSSLKQTYWLFKLSCDRMVKTCTKIVKYPNCIVLAGPARACPQNRLCICFRVQANIQSSDTDCTASNNFL